MPEISILIPTYNRAAYLCECLESCLMQINLLDKIEIIICDNSDNNDTYNALKSYIDRYDGIIYHKNDVNLWMVGNRNKCLSLVTGKYIIFLSDDDKFYANNSLDVLYTYLITHNDIWWVAWKRVIINTQWDIIEPYEINDQSKNKEGVILSHTNFIASNCIWFGWTLFQYDKDITFDEKTGLYADWDYNLAFIKKRSIVLIPTYTFFYRTHISNLSNHITIRQNNQWIYTIYKKNNIGLFKIIFSLSMRTLSSLLWKIIYLTHSKKLYNFYSKCINFIMKIKNKV